ncbi:DUF192 domain-containing protein [bacterium]|nr:DUF192 domain-containing protein [bacterium]
MPSNQKWKRVQYQQAALVALFILLLGVGVYSYAEYREKQSLLKVTFHHEESSSPPFFLEIANTPSQRSKGLMYRKHLAPDRGMLFIFPEEKQQSFWMKNTFISLDMIFVSPDQQVVGIVHSAPPLTEDRQTVPAKSTHVIELPAGTAKTHQITKNTRVKFHTPTPKPL